MGWRAGTSITSGIKTTFGSLALLDSQLSGGHFVFHAPVTLPQ